MCEVGPLYAAREWRPAGSIAPPAARAQQVEPRLDVCVIGAGLTGTSAAMHLARRGARVLVLESHTVGFGASGRNGGQIGSGLRHDVLTLERRYGVALTHFLWRLAEEAKALIGQVIAQATIDIEYRAGNLAAARCSRDLGNAVREAEHLDQAYGYTQLQVLDRPEIGALVSSDEYLGGVLDRGAGHCDPLSLTRALADAALLAGARIWERTTAVRIEPGTTTTPAIVYIPGAALHCDQVLICADAYLDPRVCPPLAGGLLGIESYVGALTPWSDSERAALMPFEGCVYTLDSPIDYYRVSAQSQLVFGSGAGLFRVGAARRLKRLRKDVRRVFPALRALAASEPRFTHVWSGLVGVTRDRMLDAGQIGPRCRYVRGYAGHGVALAVRCGQLLAAAASGDSRDFDRLAAIDVASLPGRTLRRSLASWRASRALSRDQ